METIKTDRKWRFGKAKPIFSKYTNDDVVPFTTCFLNCMLGIVSKVARFFYLTPWHSMHFYWKISNAQETKVGSAGDSSLASPGLPRPESRQTKVSQGLSPMYLRLNWGLPVSSRTGVYPWQPALKYLPRNIFCHGSNKEHHISEQFSTSVWNFNRCLNSCLFIDHWIITIKI